MEERAWISALNPSDKMVLIWKKINNPVFEGENTKLENVSPTLFKGLWTLIWTIIDII